MRRLKTCLRAAGALSCVVCFLSSDARAQSDSSGFVFGFGGRVEPLPRLEVKLGATVSTMLCVGSPLDLELEVRNADSKPVELDKSALWNNYSYSFKNPDGGGRGGGRGVSCGSCLNEMVSLPPGLLHWEKHEFSLRDKFFSKPGKYTVTIKVMGNESNRLEFELSDCGHIETEETK